MQLSLGVRAPRRFSASPLTLPIASLLVAAAVSAAPRVSAADFQWDADPDSPTVAASDGAGTWDLASNHWISGGINTPWVNDINNDAIFGAGVDALTNFLIDVNLGGEGFADSIIFNNSGYVLTADELQMITLSNPTAAISVAAGKVATIGANVLITSPAAAQNSAVVGGGKLIIADGGTLQNSGTTNSNVLNINGTTVEVQTGGSLLTTNPPQNAIFVNGTLNVTGGLVDAIGTLGIGQNSTFGAATMTVTSGTVNALSNNGVRFGGNSGTTPGGTLNLDGGTLTALKLQKGTGTVTSSVVNFNGGTLQASTAASTAFMTGLGRANVRNGGAIIDTNSKNITVAQALEHSNISGDAATDGGLTKLGAGTLTLSGANTYNGGTIIDAGGLLFSAGAIPAAGKIKINEVGTLIASGAVTSVTGLLTSGSVDASSTGTIALAADSTENIDFTGYAAVRLGATAAASYSGTLTPAANTYRLGGGGAALKLTNENALTGANDVVVAGPGSVILANTNNYTGSTTVQSGTLQVGDGTTDGSLGATSGIANDGTLLFHVLGTQVVGNGISGTGDLTKQGAGTLILSGDNSYSGATNLNNGVLQLAHSNALGASFVSGNNGATQLQLAGDITVQNPIRLQGSGAGTTGILRNVEGTNTVTDFGFLFSGGTRVAVDDGSTLRLPNAITLSGSAGPQSLRVIGTGTLFVGGDNTAAIDSASSFLLGTGAAAGPTIAVGNDLAFGAGTIDFQAEAAASIASASEAAYTIANPLRFSGTNLNEATFGSTGTGNLVFSGPATLNGALQATIDNASTTLSGAISGSHELIKAGPGALVLGGLDANLYTGGTTISEGLLTVQKDGGLGTGDVSVLAGGSLKLELGSTNNYISDDGRLLLSGTASPVNLAYTGAPDVIAGLSYDEGNTFLVPGTYGSLASTAEFKSAAFTGPGTLLVVPEPATAASLLGGLGLLLGVRRRRRA